VSTSILFLVTALVNAIWQPALIAAIAWLALKLSRCSNATTRHAVWSLALIASAIVPVVSAMPIIAPQAASIAQSTPPLSSAHAKQVPAQSIKTLPSQPLQAVPAAPVALRRPSFSMHPTVAMVVSIVWLIVALGILARLMVSFLYLERLKHDALPFAVESRHALTRYERAEKGDRDVRVCVSSEITVPVAVGIFDAMILIPSDLVNELETNDLDRILLHELAHVRRSDDWVNLIERVAQALFFFSPGIYWISRQMDLEREVACDDWVLEQSADNVPYARCLARIVEITQWPYVAPAAPGVFVTRKSMSIRIERLLARGRDVRLKLALVPSLLSVALIVGIVIAGGFVSPTIAYTIDHNIVATHASVAHVARLTAKKAAHDIAAVGLPANATATGTAAASTVVASAAPSIAAATAPPTARLHAHIATRMQTSIDRTIDTQIESQIRTATGGTAGFVTSAAAMASSQSRMVADAGYLDDLAAMGFKNLSVDEVIQMRSVGVDRAYVEGLRNAGFKNLTPRDLIQLKSLGVDGSYVADLRNAGLNDLSAHELVQLKSLNVDGEYVRALASAGYPHLDSHEYVQFKSLGVDGDWLSEMRSAGISGMDPSAAVQLKSLGVDSAYVADLANNGYAHLSTRDYVQLKSLGVDGDYIRKLAGHGFTHLSVHQLIEYKSLGISQ
jgi:beta-lactamase regulating signal transducer with metallopeptidase domain